ncbi:ATP-binding protein [Azospira restricta]|uniref:histidine kinase n=1 Tax=Azospira restricta TaxID=404405 RepID=A0A974SNQ4_9RHOO|nr:ATP-binding protein [Azospira restricta]QRJ63659.1 ATP-binding protein [Azospira restricta]
MNAPAPPSPAAPRARGSLRLRLLAGTLVWVVLSIAAAGWSLSQLFRDHVGEQFHALLASHLDQLTAGLALDAQGRPQLTTAPADPRLARPYAGLYWQVDRIGGERGALRSRSLWDAVLAVPADALADGEIHRHRVTGPDGATLGLVERSVRIADADGGGESAWRLLVAADEQLLQEPLSRFAGALWLALGILGLGLALAVVVQVGVGLAPLRALRRALARIGSGEARRLEGDYPAEVMPLVDEFNGVLAHNAEVVERARTQAGNLAHALKTPLAVLANAADGRDDELARLVAEQVGNARRQVDYHLARAQAAASRLPGARTPLAPAVDGLVRALRRLHAARGVELAVAPLPAALAFRGDAQDLQEMLGNLLDNACKWAVQRVVLAAERDGRQLVVTIDDDGQGLPPERRQEVLRRGVRADEAVPGSGLGLAIVADLARLYGGEIALAESPLGGLRARLTLPAAD